MAGTTTTTTANPTNPKAPSITVTNLTYTFPTYATGLTGVSLSVPPRSRTLLVGANGAGKTTLLRLLAGKRLAPAGAISVAGADPFQATPEGVTYLGLEWVLNPAVRADVGVGELLRSVGGDAYPARRDELVAVLDVDAGWRMHAVSDGERRRVQLAMGLVRPWAVLLLDEITVDLDVLSRARFLAWLRRETEGRACTVVYATHILDNLAGWPTHLVHMHLGRVREWGPAERFLPPSPSPSPSSSSSSSSSGQGGKSDNKNADNGDDGDGDGGVTATVAPVLGSTGNSRLGELVLRWLEKDLEDRGPRNQMTMGTEGLTYAPGGIGGYGLENRPGTEK